MINAWLEMVATKLGVANGTVILALWAFFALILFTLLLRKHKYKRMLSEAAKKSSHSTGLQVTAAAKKSRDATGLKVTSTNFPELPKASTPINATPPKQMTTLSPRTSATNLAQPTDVELPKVIIKQLQGVVADAGKLKALFSKIDKLDTIVAELGKLEHLTARIDKLEAIVVRMEKLPTSSAPQLADKPETKATVPPPPPIPQQAQPPPFLPTETPEHKMLLSEGSDLPEELHGFFTLLITKHIWEEKEIRRIALKNGLMHNDAVDKINAWAYDKCGDHLVVDDNGQFIVQKDIFARDVSATV